MNKLKTEKLEGIIANLKAYKSDNPVTPDKAFNVAWEYQEKKINKLIKCVEYYADTNEWFKKWGHKDYWAIDGSGKKARETLKELYE